MHVVFSRVCHVEILLYPPDISFLLFMCCTLSVAPLLAPRTLQHKSKLSIAAHAFSDLACSELGYLLHLSYAVSLYTVHFTDTSCALRPLSEAVKRKRDRFTVEILCWAAPPCRCAYSDEQGRTVLNGTYEPLYCIYSSQIPRAHKFIPLLGNASPGKHRTCAALHSKFTSALFWVRI